MTDFKLKPTNPFIPGLRPNRRNARPRPRSRTPRGGGRSYQVVVAGRARTPPTASPGHCNHTTSPVLGPPAATARSVLTAADPLHATRVRRRTPPGEPRREAGDPRARRALLRPPLPLRGEGPGFGPALEEPPEAQVGWAAAGRAAAGLPAPAVHYPGLRTGPVLASCAWSSRQVSPCRCSRATRWFFPRWNGREDWGTSLSPSLDDTGPGGDRGRGR